VDRASVRRDGVSGDRGRCNKIQGAQGVENAEATSLASGRNADESDARYCFTDEASRTTHPAHAPPQSLKLGGPHSLLPSETKSEMRLAEPRNSGPLTHTPRQDCPNLALLKPSKGPKPPTRPTSLQKPSRTTSARPSNWSPQERPQEFPPSQTPQTQLRSTTHF